MPELNIEIWRLHFQINTLSVYCHGGFTIVSLTVEQCIVIATVHIPVAAINYFTAQCRAKHTSTTQVQPHHLPFFNSTHSHTL